MTHQLYEIWQLVDSFDDRPWRAQMKNYVAQFETEEQAQRYVSAIQKIAEDAGKRNDGTRHKNRG